MGTTRNERARVGRSLNTMVRSLALVVVLLASACGGDENGDETAGTSATTDDGGTATDNTAGDTQGETEVSSSCEEPNGDEVGSVEKIRFEEVELDCEVVAGGERFRRGSTVTTNSTGVADIELDSGPNCRLYPAMTVRVIDDGDTAFEALDEGDLTCRSALNLIVPGGVISPVNGPAELVVTIGDVAHVSVIDGFAIFEHSGLACSALIGPRQQVEIGPGSELDVRAFDPMALPDRFGQAVLDHGLALEAPLLDEGLVPGLHEAVESGDATIAINGELIGSEAVAGTSEADVAEVLVGAEVDLRPTVGRIDLGRSIGTPVTIAAPADFEQVVVADLDVDAVDPDAVTDALDEGSETAEPIEFVELPVLVDPTGRVWTVAVDATDDVSADVSFQLDAAVRSGSYGRTYEAIFASTPDYNVLIPDLIATDEQC